MDALFYIDNWCCLQARKVFRLQQSYFSEMSVLLRFFRRNSQHLRGIDYQYDEPSVQGDKIWIFWAQGYDNMPVVVKKCYESVLKNRGVFDVILLDMENIKQYIDIPAFIYRKVDEKKITLTHFSDILRFSLLRKYGGWWIDSTVFVSKSMVSPTQLFTIKQCYNNMYVSEAKWCGFLWYMPKNHSLARFMVDYLYDYWKKYDNLIEYLLIDYLIQVFYERNGNFRKEIEALSETNPDLYFFQDKASEQLYNEEEWEKIINRTQFFKTTWKMPRKSKRGGMKTFYGYFLS